LWEYKAERDGGNAQGYTKLSKEIDQYLAEHRDDKRAAATVGNFVVRHQDQLPAEFVERVVSTLDAKRNDPKHSLRAQIVYTRAVKETDPRKRLAALDAFITNYPEAVEVSIAQVSRLSTFVELKDTRGAEAALASYRIARARDRDLIGPNGFNVYLQMAQLYIDSHEKLDTALQLVDEAQETLKAFPGPHGITIPTEVKQQVEARCAEMRARAYLVLHKPDQALAEAEKALPGLKESAEAHFVMAQAYALAGDKSKALDEYFEAALMPSNDDLKYRAELERFYRKNFGNEKDYEAALNKRIADRFQATHYVPKLLDQPAPVLEFTTLKGEKFDSKELSGKTVILNFWSPG
jgi:tetratricopeptide (TPR) repeat protein